jgi:RNA polymerase sigma-70 factor (ECF subfamily)
MPRVDNGEGGQTLEPTSDQEVMMQVRAGDVEQLSILFERHHGRLFGYCLGILGNRESARDLVQEVFFRLLKYRDSFRPEAPFAPWLYRLARNACIDHLRKSGRERPTEDDFDRPDPTPLVPEEMERREELQKLQTALARLPEDKRELLLLARSGTLSYEQIATLLGCSVGALKVRVHRALQLLREAYTRVDSEALS